MAGGILLTSGPLFPGACRCLASFPSPEVRKRAHGLGSHILAAACPAPALGSGEGQGGRAEGTGQGEREMDVEEALGRSGQGTEALWRGPALGLVLCKPEEGGSCRGSLSSHSPALVDGGFLT